MNGLDPETQVRAKSAPTGREAKPGLSISLNRTLLPLVCVLSLAMAGNAEAAPANQDAASQRASPVSEALEHLDRDAGLVLRVDLGALGKLSALVSELFPAEKQAIGLAGIGSAAILGFYPFEEKAWQRSGFDTQFPLLVQVAAASAGDAGLRTRALLRANRPAAARKTIASMRLAEKAQLGDDKALARLLGNVRERPAPKVVRKTLPDAGVFLVDRPRPLEGLLVAREVQGIVILDLVKESGRTFDELLALTTRRPKALASSTPGASALASAPLALWLRPTFAANTLERVASGNRKRARFCSRVANVARQGSTDSLSVTVQLKAAALAFEIQSHGTRNDAYVGLEAASSPLLAGHPLLDVQVRLANWAALRDRDKPALAQDWDRLWANVARCGTSSRVLTIAATWPELIGSFLSEVSAIHPSAKTVVEAMGPASATMGRTAGGAPTIVAEAWVREAGAKHARAWLKSLFGSENVRGPVTTWGKGAMQPYAIAKDGGSIIGAGFRPEARSAAVAAARTQSTRVESLVSLRARPASLVKAFSEVPLPDLWKPWALATGSLVVLPSRATLSLELRR